MGAGGAISSPGRNETKIAAQTEHRRKSILTQKSDGLPWGGLETSIKRTFKTGVGGKGVLPSLLHQFDPAHIPSLLFPIRTRVIHPQPDKLH